MASTDSSAPLRTTHRENDELLDAARYTMRLLQDRQENTPEELLDPRECKALRRLRSSLGRVVDVEEEL